MDFTFSRTISKAVLENYLQRSASFADAIHSDTPTDDLRMIANTGVRFLGRSAYIWRAQEPDEPHFAKAAAFAKSVHAIDSTVICQACIFEAVYNDCEQTPIPDWVFAAFGHPPEKRNFSYAAIVGPVFQTVYRWSGDVAAHERGVVGSVPDITQLEARMWFYYRARRYMEAGYEAIHMGQPHLYGGRDAGYAATRETFARIRELARQYARRGLVLLDAHTHGISHRGHTLLDFNSRPFSPLGHPTRVNDVQLIKNGTSRGGVTPSGWACQTLPYLWEVDNYGGYAIPPEQFDDHRLRANAGWWGYDDIGWFAHQPEAARNAFLEYAQRWTEAADPAAFFQVPLRRTLGRATLEVTHPDGTTHHVDVYKANTRSAACPDGQSQEETIKRLWAESPERHAPDTPAATYPADPATGLDLPGLVVLVGSIQSALGEWRPNPSSSLTTMTHAGGGTFVWTGVLRDPEPVDCFVAVGGTMTELLRPNGFASGPALKIVPTRPNARVTVTFTYWPPTLTAAGDVMTGDGPVGGQAAIRR